MTDTEMRSHFAVWAMMAILKNQNLIAIDQDTVGETGRQRVP